MVMDRIKAVVDQILSRVSIVRGKGEEATKQALVLPMLDALGFDIWNPSEVCPEYDADFATKKLGQKEKVDFAIFLEGVPRAYFEVKSVEVPLDGHEGQLARYFNATPSVSLAVLTNGVEYRFYTDTGDPNIMDSKAFHVAKLDAIDQGLEILGRFHRTVFSPDAIRDFATELNYTAKIATFLRKQLDLGEREPSELFVRWVLSEEGTYTGRLTANVIERFQPIIKEALQIVLRDIVRRSVAALDKEVTSPSVTTVQQTPSLTPPLTVLPASTDAESPPDDRSKIVTTENELQVFAIAKAIFEASEFFQVGIYDSRTRKNVPIEISYKDTSGYFGICLNKPSFWVIRAVTESKVPWIGFNVAPEVGDPLVPEGFQKLPPHPYAEFRVAISVPRDINSLSRLFLASIQKTIEDRIPSKAAQDEEGGSPVA
jgi:hypothetical protein